MSKKLDPRVVRTRRWLRDALIELVTEKGYLNVMVQEITERAGLNRATFYLHYKDKDELLYDCARELFEDVIRRVEAGKSNEHPHGYRAVDAGALIPVFEHFAKYAAFYRVVLGANGVQSFALAVRSYYSDLLQEQYAQKLPGADPALIGGLAAYHAAGLLGLATWWLEQDMPWPPAVMAETLLQIIAFEGQSPAGQPPEEIE